MFKIKNKKLNEEEMFITKNLERAINVIKETEKMEEEDKNNISISQFCKNNKDKVIGEKKVFSYLRENDFIEYDKYKNNIPTKKSKELGLMIEKTDISIDTTTGLSYLRKSPKLTKGGQLYFLEVLKRN